MTEIYSTVGTFRCPICMKDYPHSHPYSRWIGVDFDGTVAYNVKNRTSPYELGLPIPAMVNRIRDWLYKGYNVKLLTARMNKKSSTGVERDVDKMRKLLEGWCEEHIGVPLECTNAKDGFMEVLWDDRAVSVIPNTGIPTVLYIEGQAMTAQEIEELGDDPLSLLLPDAVEEDEE